MSANKITLYRSSNPMFWLVDATNGPNKGLSICSGDASAEWYVRVAPEHQEELLAALRARKERLGLADVTTANGEPLPDDEVLRLLFENFGNRSSNPYTEIGEFLDESEIQTKHEFWGSM